MSDVFVVWLSEAFFRDEFGAVPLKGRGLAEREACGIIWHLQDMYFWRWTSK